MAYIKPEKILGDENMLDSNKYVYYNETLTCVEKFLKKTCIKNICVDICKGQCCSGCWESKFACHKNEGIRLSCSCFLCIDLISSLRDLLKRSEKDVELSTCLISVEKTLHYITSDICKYVHKYRNKEVSAYKSSNIYFLPPSAKSIKKFRTDREYVKILRSSIRPMSQLIMKALNDKHFCETFIDSKSNKT